MKESTEQCNNGNYTPGRFSEFRNHHANQSIIVCGCGSSLKELTHPEDFITIGVNDVGRLFEPNYLVVLNSRNQFKGDRFRYIEKSTASALFTNLSLGINHKNIVRFKLGQRGGTDISDLHSLPYTRNSPYVAICLAMYMGAKRIGVIGVDFTPHHFFSKTGVHSLSKSLSKIKQEYRSLYLAAEKRGVEIVNLSQQSRIDVFPKKTLDDFYQNTKCELNKSERIEKLNIVSYSCTPVSGVPEILARCVNESTPHQCVCVWASNDYGNGVKFNSAIEWKKKPVDALNELKRADVVIVHNGRVDARHLNIIRDKPVITMAHNYIWNVAQDYIKKGFPGVVVGQYQATLPEFEKWNVVPNPFAAPDMELKPQTKNKEITICYTPSGKHDVYPKSHRLYWHSKGYASTMKILQRICKNHPVKLEVIRNKQMPHEQVMAMKMRSHIVIDECVTGSYHRNSLEGLACGCVVINGMGILPDVEKVLSECTENAVSPFVGATLAELESTLVKLIESGRDSLIKSGKDNQYWFTQHWDFTKQWQTFWWPVIEKARKISSKPIKQVSVKQQRLKQKVAPDIANTLSKNITDNPTQALKSVNKTSAIPVYWTCRNGRRGNFGDMLSPVLTRALSGRPAIYRQSTPRLFVVGSLLKFAEKGDHVWGTGFIKETDTARQGVIVHAVRGPLTRKKLLAQGIECPEVYGDPALLLPALYPDKKQLRKGIGIIPHYVDYAWVKQAVKQNGIRIIDIRAGIENVLREVKCCEVILSSSLHGCVLADAYKIPHVWVIMSDKVIGGGFKFCDYYASIDREVVSVDWRKKIDIDYAVNKAIKAEKANINLLPLIKSFPYLSANEKIINKFSSAMDLSFPCDTSKSKVEDSVIVLKSQSSKSEVTINKDKHTGVDLQTKDQKHNEKIAVFGVATENYIEYLIASLRTFKKHNGSDDFDYYILGRAFSARSQRLINKYGIQYINLNLKSDFVRNPRHRYPGECFWIFKGPEIFYKRGYQYSLSVDGDVLCNNKLDLSWLPKLDHLAGVDRGCSVGTFLQSIGQLSRLTRKFGKTMIDTQRRATNTGVLFYNNSELNRIGFYARMVKAYQCSERAGISRGGDDSTLALLLSLHTDIKLHILPNSWNVYRGMFKATDGNSVAENEIKLQYSNAYIIHFIPLKPWQHHTRYPNQLTKDFINDWRRLWPNTRNQRRIQSLSQAEPLRNKIRVNSSRLLRKNEKNRYDRLPIYIYWYRGSRMNMGDEITPYLLAKILGLRTQDIQRLNKEPAKVYGLVLVSVGSVMRLCHSNTLIWGSGIRNIDQPVSKALQFNAVRGPLTRQRLIQLGYECPEIYGDPALLLPRYYQPAVDKKYSLGIIPHLVDYDDVHKIYAKEHGILIIDVNTGDIEKIIRQILSCECTVSSSLHGIVLSVAYGIATRWLKCSDKIMGDDTKFIDFFSSLDPSLLNVLDYSTMSISSNNKEYLKYKPFEIKDKKIAAEELVANTYTYNMTLKLDSLLKSFPLEYFNQQEKIA